MPSATGAPWSLPYPLGSDPVADGDNAIRSLAERQAAVDNALPRGLIARLTAGSTGNIGDILAIGVPSFTTTEDRDFMGVISLLGKSVGAGTGVTVRVQDNGVSVNGSDHIAIWAPSSFDATASGVLTFPLAAGTHVITVRYLGYGSNSNTSTSSLFSLFDMGATGAI